MKPRNPFAVLANKRKAGSHRKSNKALRRKEKVRDCSLTGQNIRLLTGKSLGSNPSSPTI